MLTVFGAVAELEREYILQRQKEGIAIAKAEGKYKGRKRIENANFNNVYQKWQAQEITAVEAMKILNIKPDKRVNMLAIDIRQMERILASE